MTPDQIGLVEQSFGMIRPMKGQIAGLFYRRLFEIAPDARALFHETNMTRQSLRLMATLNLFVGLLRRPDDLAEAGRELAERHAGYGVKPADYAPFGDALMWTLSQCLGPAFDAETQAAWRAAYDAIARAMTGIDAASELRAAG